MKIVKKGENSVANGTSMGVNELSDEDLEDVEGGYKIKGNLLDPTYYFNEDEARLLSMWKQKYVVPGKGYSQADMVKILGCKNENWILRTLGDYGFSREW